jgi:transposase-like protein
MGQFSMEISRAAGSVLNGNQQTDMLERLNEEIGCRTYVVRIFPNPESCLRLVRALAAETNENSMEANR